MKLTTHLLNAATGKDAAGVSVSVVADGALLFIGETDEHGRLAAEVAVAAGAPCELSVRLTDYFGGEVSAVSVTFAAAARRHLPLIIAPNSCTFWCSA